MLKYFTSILFLAFSLSTFAQQQAPPDSVEEEQVQPEKKPVIDSISQIRFGLDLSRIAFNQLQKDLEKRTSYEFEVDYFLKKDLYIVAEGGFGDASLTYDDLAYESSNIFVRGGINKSLLPRLRKDDWDMAFVGLRYAFAPVQRSAANYKITDSTWGIVTGSEPATSFTVHWLEVTGGVRVEVAKRIFIGWNIRGRFMLNPKKFQELPPYNIAGYGKGEKNTIFDFNVFLSYAIRWDRIKG